MKQLKILLLPLLAVTMFTTSCKVSFVPAKDPAMTVDVLNTSIQTNNLYKSMLDSKSYTFKAYEQDYQTISDKMDSIIARNKVRKKAGQITSQMQSVKDLFSQYLNDHRDKGKLSPGEIKVYQKYMQSIWRPVLVSELSLK